MVNIDLYVSGDNSVLDIEHDYLLNDCSICIHNNPINPSSIAYLRLPSLDKTDTPLSIYSSITAKNSENDQLLDLIFLLQNDTHIYNGVFRDFNKVMFTDSKVLASDGQGVILSENEFNNNTLIINNLRAREAIIFASKVELLNGGFVKNLLGISLHGIIQNIMLQGEGENLAIGELDIKPNINELKLENVTIGNKFIHSSIKELLMHNVKAKNNWQIDGYTADALKIDMLTGAYDNRFTADKVTIHKIISPKGKFYIAAKSYINFNIDHESSIAGYELVMDMSDSDIKTKKVIFPSKPFKFETVTIIGANDVSILSGGYCRKLLFDNCANVVADSIEAAEIKYNYMPKAYNEGKLYFSGIAYNSFSITGFVEAIFKKLDVNSLEGVGLCRFVFQDKTKCKMLQLNLNIDAHQPQQFIFNDKFVPSLNINTLTNEAVCIDTILAKLSTFYVKGKATLGDVIIQPIDKISNLFWVDSKNFNGLSIQRLLMLSECQLCVSPDGTIRLVQTKNQITSGNIYAAIDYAQVEKCAYVSAGGSIIFQGALKIDNGDGGLFSKYGDIFINGKMVAQNKLSMIAEKGIVNVQNAILEANQITIYSKQDTNFNDTIINAVEFVTTSLDGFINFKNVKLRSNCLVIVAEDDIGISDSSFKTNKLYMQSNNSTSINNSNIVAHDMFTESVRQFLLSNSNIDIKHQRFALFGHQFDEEHLQGGFRAAKDFQIIGIFGDGNSQHYVDIKWHRVDFKKDIVPSEGRAYIDAQNGYIMGSNLNSDDSIIIRTKESLEVVPLVLHNELIDAGGYNKTAIKTVISRINSGLIDIKAEKSVTFIGSALKAAIGKLDADLIHTLASPTDILKQQHRINELGKFADDVFLGKSNLEEVLNFQKSTNVASRISNLNVYDNFKSQELYYTHKQGDIVLDKSLSGYEKLQITAANGKILINSLHLQQIYKGSGGGDKGKQSALDSRTVIGGEDVYLIADEVISQASKFNVSGELKIITKNGVHLLPVSVHQSLMYHKGSKTTISEREVRLVVSEINAGYLNIKACEAFNAVSSLIQATGVDLDVNELNLLSEREIFEKRIVFQGKEKWYGGSRSSEDIFRDEYVIPTLIKTDKLNAKVNGTTTIEAAQILVKEESTIDTKGDVNLLAKYDIHLHDHKSSKSFLFNFDKGNLKVAGTKTVKEHFYGEAPVPTLYYNQGNFYGYSEGKVHLLGSKIIGNDIYLYAEKGIKLEASPFSQEKIVTISEECVRVGFSTGGGKHSFDAEFISQEEKTKFKNTFYSESELIARNHMNLETKDIIEVISSKMQFNTAKVKARGFHMHTHSEKTEFESSKTIFKAGLHFGVQENISSTANTIGHVLNKKGVHLLDITDRILNGYEAFEGITDIYQDIEKLSALSKDSKNNSNIINSLKSVQYGLWGGVSGSTTHTLSNSTKAVDNELIGGDIEFDIEEDVIVEGIKCTLNNLSLKAKNAFFSTSKDTNNQETYSANIDITVPIYGSVGGNVSTGFKKSQSGSVSYHNDNVVNVKGKLELNLTSDGVVSGVQFIANEIDIKAKNFLVESLQDVLKARMQGMNMSFGMSGENTNTFGVKADIGKQDGAWTNAIGSIIGRNVVNVTVQQTLEIVGGLIANAETNEDGSLNDKGQANIKVGKIIAKQLYDYDDGYSYGLGISLSKTVDPKTGDVKYGKKVPVKYSFNEKNRDILPTIGKGNLDVDSIDGLLNRDIDKHIGNTHIEKASLDAKIPVSDILEVIKPKTGVNSGDTDDKVKDKDQKRKIIDLSPDTLFLNKLASLFKMDQDSEVARMLQNTQIGDINDQSVFDIYGSEDIQDNLKPIKIYDVKSSAKIDSNNHGLKKDSFVRNGKEVTSYRNSLGHFSKKPSAYNYSINAQIPLINIGGEKYSHEIINGTDITLGDTTFQTGMTAYGREPYLVFGLHNGLSTNIGWKSGILVANADLDNGANISASIFETAGVAGLNLGKSGFGAKAGFKASLANAKYRIPISEKCFMYTCFESDVTFEAGLGVSSKAEIGLSKNKAKASLGGGKIAYGEVSIGLSFSQDKEYFVAQQKRTEQIQAKYEHFNTEIKKYSADVISKISMMDLFDFGNHEDFDSILMLAKAYNKK